MTSNNPTALDLGQQPLVSIIMNCFNGEKYLREAIDSVLAQTYQNWEVVLWDNQSTDKSAEIFKNYQDVRMKYFFAPEHTDLGQGRNLAIEQARGEWIGFLDCDDIWLPLKLEKQVSIVNASGADLGLVYSEAGPLVEEEGRSTNWGRKIAKQSGCKKNQDLPSGNIFPAMLQGNLIPLVSALVRRSAFIKVGGVSSDMKQAEDYELFVKISEHYKAMAIQEVTCQFRIHGNNWTHNQSEMSYTESLQVVKRYLPLQAAKAGARIWQANYAGYLFMNRRYFDGLSQLISSRSLAFFLTKSCARVFTSIQNIFSRS